MITVEPWKVLYIVAHRHAPLGQVTPFQLFTDGPLSSAGLLHLVASWPKDVREFRLTTEQAAALRMVSGASCIILIRVDELAELLELTSEQPFRCVLSDERCAADAAEAVRRSNVAVLHVSECPMPGAVEASIATSDDLYRYIVSTAKLAVASGSTTPWHREFSDDQPREPRDGAPLPLTRADHLLGVPNEQLFTSLGFTLGEPEPPLLGDADSYLRTVVRSFDRAWDFRRFVADALPVPNAILSPSLTLTAPSIIRGIGTGGRREMDRATQAMQTAARAITRQTGYEQRLPAAYAPAVVEEEGRQVLALRGQELRLYAYALAVRASAGVTPVLRLPPGVNHAVEAARNLARSIRRARAFDASRASRLARRLSASLTDGLAPGLVERMRKTDGFVKIIADAPLEWLEVDGLPLALARDCARIDTTPGNLFLQ
jgi:hypothetical protein